MKQSETDIQRSHDSSGNMVAKVQQEVVQGHEHWYHLSRKTSWLAAIYCMLFVIFWIVRLRLEAVFILGLSTVSFILNNLLKLLIHRPRPSASLVEIIQHAQGQSFPSGHVMSYVAFWGLLFSFSLIVFKRDRWWRYPILLVSAFFVVLVGPSRIYLGDHWASDVLGAYLIGGLLLGLSLWLYRALLHRHILGRDGSESVITKKELG